jgi:hypothetical protein
MARLTSLCCATLLLLLWPSHTSAANHRVERNVVYGMYSGLALLLDIGATIDWFDRHLRTAN